MPPRKGAAVNTRPKPYLLRPLWPSSCHYNADETSSDANLTPCKIPNRSSCPTTSRRCCGPDSKQGPARSRHHAQTLTLFRAPTAAQAPLRRLLGPPCSDHPSSGARTAPGARPSPTSKLLWLPGRSRAGSWGLDVVAERAPPGGCPRPLPTPRAGCQEKLQAFGTAHT